MITLKNVKSLGGNVIDHTIESSHTQVIDGQGRLLMLPTLTDIDASLGPLSGIPQEITDWTENARNYLDSGITTVFDAVSQSSSHISHHLLLANESLRSSNMPLHVHLFFDGNFPEEFDNISKIKPSAIGIKISLDLGNKPIAAPHLSSLDRLFQLAAQENMIVTIALNEGIGNITQQRKTAYESVAKAINLAEKYSTELCFLHVRTIEELELIRDAKKRGILVYAEVALIHFFLNDTDFPNTAPINEKVSFLPSIEDQKALWNALKDDIIDMTGSAGRFSPPALELPLLFDAYKQNRIQIDKIIGTTRVNPEAIFRLTPNRDVVLVDTDTERKITPQMLQKYPLIKPWINKAFTGWPVHVIASGEVFSILK